MWIDAANARLELTAHHPLRLSGAIGTTLRAAQGTLWITIDADPRDIVLDAGEQFVVDSCEPLLVLPLGERATVHVLEARTNRAAGAAARRPPGVRAAWRRALAFS